MKEVKPLWEQYKKEYSVWAQMLNRCRSSSHPQYYLWGGRGIKVCKRWYIFKNFLEDMGPRPSGPYSLERKNGDGHYRPSNCYWATPTEQSNNTRRNIKLTYKGETLSLAQWARKMDMPYDRVRARYLYGWPTDKILFSPMNKHHKRVKLV